MKISKKEYKQSMVIDRVGVVLEKFDIPKEFPTGLYCRREKTENATIKLNKIEGESVLSDIFHIRIFEINRECPAQINLPLYKVPTEKEQMVLRFYNCPLEDVPIDECIIQNKVLLNHDTSYFNDDDDDDDDLSCQPCCCYRCVPFTFRTNINIISTIIVISDPILSVHSHTCAGNKLCMCCIYTTKERGK